MLALFVALGGTATALKGKFSVKRDDIAPRAVDASKIKKGAVNGNLISDKAIGSWKLRLGATAAASAEASTTSTVPVDLGGPKATVKVPEGGMVAIQAEAWMRSTGNNNAARVYLYEPTIVPNPIMISRSEATNNFQFRTSLPGSADGATNRVRGGWIVMPVSAPGTKSFELRYSTSGGTAIFKDRVLRVVVIR